MVRPLFTRLFSQPKGSPEARARRERARQAFDEGSPGVLSRLPFMRAKDPWTLEWQNRRQEAVDQYWRNKRQLLVSRRSSDRDLEERLDREQADIDRYYRVHELREGDPRRERAVREARHKFRLAERQMRRKHREGWQRQLRVLQLSRDKAKRKVTRSMKLEYRRARGLDTGGLPWR
ncbi:MAG: hypothetical protein HY372_02785 [Candidatus Andersenbacteria bacterium]|nr:hypothetical protein [Candidatus Andersenbacteria bacterium]